MFDIIIIHKGVEKQCHFKEISAEMILRILLIIFENSPELLADRTIEALANVMNSNKT